MKEKWRALRSRCAADPGPHAALVLALAVAAVLRFYALGEHSLWNDELSTWRRQHLGLSNPRFYEALWNDYHPPGYLVVMSAWCKLFGESEFALRAPSALCGVLLVGAVFGFCRRAFDLNTAAVCALLTAVSPFLLHYSQEARAFMPTALLCTLAATRVLGLCTAPVAQLGWWSSSGPVASAALLAACGYLQYTGLLCAATLLGFALLHAVVWERARVRIVLGCIGLCSALYLPWLPVFIHHLGMGGLHFLSAPSFEELWSVPAKVLPSWVPLLACVFIAFGARRRGLAAHAALGSVGAALTTWWLLSLVVGMWLKSRVSEPIFSDRNLLVAMPALLALLSAAVTRTSRRFTSSALAAVVLAGLTLWQGLWVDRYYAKRTLQDFRAATHQAAEWAKHDADSTLLAFTHHKHYVDYYLERAGSPARAAAHVQSGDELLKELRRLGAKQAIVVAGHIQPSDRELKKIRKKYKIVKHVKKKAASVLLLERK